MWTMQCFVIKKLKEQRHSRHFPPLLALLCRSITEPALQFSRFTAMQAWHIYILRSVKLWLALVPLSFVKLTDNVKWSCYKNIDKYEVNLLHITCKPSSFKLIYNILHFATMNNGSDIQWWRPLKYNTIQCYECRWGATQLQIQDTKNFRPWLKCVSLFDPLRQNKVVVSDLWTHFLYCLIKKKASLDCSGSPDLHKK